MKFGKGMVAIANQRSKYGKILLILKKKIGTAVKVVRLWGRYVYLLKEGRKLQRRQVNDHNMITYDWRLDTRAPNTFLLSEKSDPVL